MKGLGESQSEQVSERRRTIPWKKLGRVFGVLVIVASIYYMGRTIWLHVGEIDWASVTLRPLPLIISIALTTFCVGLGGWAWQLVLLSLGYSLSLGKAMIVHTTAALAKYVPGYAWQLLGKTYLTQREGVPVLSATVALVLELGGLLLTGLLTALLCLPRGLALPLIGRPIPDYLRWSMVALTLAFCVATPWLAQTLGRWAGRVRGPRWRTVLAGASALRASWLWAALAVMFVGWVLFGLALGWLMEMLQSLAFGDWLLGIYTLAISFVISLLTPFVPGGIGVREGIMTYSLQQALSPAAAVTVAVLSRLTVTVGELLAFALTWLWRAVADRFRSGPSNPNNRSITQKD